MRSTLLPLASMLEPQPRDVHLSILYTPRTRIAIRKTQPPIILHPANLLHPLHHLDDFPLLPRRHLKTADQCSSQWTDVVPIRHGVIFSMPIKPLWKVAIDIKYINACVCTRSDLHIVWIVRKLKGVRSRGFLGAATGVGRAVYVGGDKIVLMGGVGALAESEIIGVFCAVGGNLEAIGAGLVGLVSAGGFLEDIPEGGGGFEMSATATRSNGGESFGENDRVSKDDGDDFTRRRCHCRQLNESMRIVLY